MINSARTVKCGRLAGIVARLLVLSGIGTSSTHLKNEQARLLPQVQYNLPLVAASLTTVRCTAGMLQLH